MAKCMLKQACENALRDWNKVFGEGYMVEGEAEDWNTESPLRTCTRPDWSHSWGFVRCVAMSRANASSPYPPLLRVFEKLYARSLQTRELWIVACSHWRKNWDIPARALRPTPLPSCMRVQKAFRFNVSRRMAGLRQSTRAAENQIMRSQARRPRPMCGSIHTAAARCMKSRSQTNGEWQNCVHAHARARAIMCTRVCEI